MLCDGGPRLAHRFSDWPSRTTPRATELIRATGARMSSGHNEGMELRTERLMLREFRLDDEVAVHRYGSDEEVTRHLTWGPNSPAETAAYLNEVVHKAAREPRTSFPLAVVALDDELIGVANLS